MAIFFGSRVRGNARPNSDWDVFLEADEIPNMPANLLIGNGGDIDAFEMPGADGWADNIASGNILKVFDGSFCRVDVHVDMSLSEFLAIYAQGQTAWPLKY